jgi:hypothetical protein
VIALKAIMVTVAAVVAMAFTTTAAMAAQPPNPVPGPPVAYDCEDTGTVGIWDDQFFEGEDPLCAFASENFLLCLAKFGQFQIETPSVEDFAAHIVGLYVAAGASATQGKCLPQTRTYWLCYGTGANSVGAYDQVTAVKMLADGARVPHASKTITTDTKVGDHYLTCNDGDQKPTGTVVSTGNGGEVVSGAPSIGAGLLLTNPLDYTAEVA